MYHVYTDGSCSSNGAVDAVAGWAYIILNEAEEQIIDFDAGNQKPGTNNIGELLAILFALQKINELNSNEVIIYTDSTYALKGITEWRHSWKAAKWTRNGLPLKNRDLWIKIDEQLCASDKNIIFQHVKGHAGNVWNEWVDKLAVEARNQ